MVSVEQLDILPCIIAAHIVAYHLKHSIEICCDNDMDEVFSDNTGFYTFAIDHFHIFVCIFNFNIHQLINKTGKPGSV